MPSPTPTSLGGWEQQMSVGATTQCSRRPLGSCRCARFLQDHTARAARPRCPRSDAVRVARPCSRFGITRHGLPENLKWLYDLAVSLSVQTTVQTTCQTVITSTKFSGRCMPHRSLPQQAWGRQLRVSAGAARARYESSCQRGAVAGLLCLCLVVYRHCSLSSSTPCRSTNLQTISHCRHR